MSWPSSFGRGRSTSTLTPMGRSNQGARNFEKYLYVQVKLLNFIELAFNENKISKKEFEEHLAEKMSKINDLKMKIPNFNPEQFINDYDLGNQVWAIHRLKSKSGTVEERMKVLVKVYDKAKNYLGTLEIQADNPLVSHLKGDLLDFLRLLDKCRQCGYLKPDFRQSDINELRRLEQKMSKQNVNDVINQQEFDSLVYSTDDIFKELKIILSLE